ncbi:MAG TPA: hypothetical protein VIJ61_09865, partial [Thermoanaerobaculia bacterium]
DTGGGGGMALGEADGKGRRKRSGAGGPSAASSPLSDLSETESEPDPATNHAANVEAFLESFEAALRAHDRIPPTITKDEKAALAVQRSRLTDDEWSLHVEALQAFATADTNPNNPGFSYARRGHRLGDFLADKAPFLEKAREQRRRGAADRQRADRERQEEQRRHQANAAEEARITGLTAAAAADPAAALAVMVHRLRAAGNTLHLALGCSAMEWPDDDRALIVCSGFAHDRLSKHLPELEAIFAEVTGVGREIFLREGPTRIKGEGGPRANPLSGGQPP